MGWDGRGERDEDVDGWLGVNWRCISVGTLIIKTHFCWPRTGG